MSEPSASKSAAMLITNAAPRLSADLQAVGGPDGGPKLHAVKPHPRFRCTLQSGNTEECLQTKNPCSFQLSEGLRQESPRQGPRDAAHLWPPSSHEAGPLSKGGHTEAHTHLSSGESTWKVLSMTVVHCRQRMTKVLGRGLSVFISWHSADREGGQGRESGGQPCWPAAHIPSHRPRATWCRDTLVTESALALSLWGSRSTVCRGGGQTTRQ